MPHPQDYRQYLLHCDPQERVSVVGVVRGPGQATPIHDHTVRGMIGRRRGAGDRRELCAVAAGREALGEDRLDPGMIDLVSPRPGDGHRGRNAHDDRVSVGIHVYGADLGRTSWSVFDPGAGRAKTFVPGVSGTRPAAS